MKKSVARNEKSCTFAPAFGTEEGTKRGDAGSGKFIESLRPAQDRRGVSRARDRNLLRRNTKENIKAEPEIQKKIRVQQYYNEEFDPGSG